MILVLLPTGLVSLCFPERERYNLIDLIAQLIWTGLIELARIRQYQPVRGWEPWARHPPLSNHMWLREGVGHMVETQQSQDEEQPGNTSLLGGYDGGRFS